MEMTEIMGPYEILDLEDGQSVTIRIRSYERGRILIHPRYQGAPSEKWIPALRVHMQEGVKAFPPMYYDLTSKTLQAQLMPFLAAPDFERFEFVITKHGVAPRARFTLERRRL